MRKSHIFAALLLASASAHAENLQAHINKIARGTAILDVNAQDFDSAPASTAITVKICFDSPTFAANCTTAVASGGAGHALSYTIGATLGSVNPKDGAQHKIYVKAQSIVSTPANDVVADGSPWPFKWTNGDVDSMYFAKLEARPTRITAAQLGLLANASDPLSVGSAGNTICNLSGTLIKDDGFVGYYASVRSVPCANIQVVTTAVTSQITVAQYAIDIAPAVALFGANIQAIGVGWVQPNLVVPVAGFVYSNTLNSVIANGGTVYQGTTVFNCSNNGAAIGQGSWPDNTSNTGGHENPYFNSTSAAPFTDLGFRPTMMVAGEKCTGCTNSNASTWTADFASFKIALDRSFAADNTNQSGKAYWNSNAADVPRSQTYLFIPSSSLGTGLSSKIQGAQASTSSGTIVSPSIMAYEESANNFTTGAPVNFMLGSLAYAFSSTTGGIPQDVAAGQTVIPFFLNKGAAAVYGHYTEPCTNIIMRLPMWEIAIPMYAQGQTAIEALWKSVRYPWTGTFMGDPLAAPYSVPIPGPTFLGATIGGVTIQ